MLVNEAQEKAILCDMLLCVFMVIGDISYAGEGQTTLYGKVTAIREHRLQWR